MKKRRCGKNVHFTKKNVKPMKYQHLDLPKSLLKTTLFFLSSKKNHIKKSLKKHRKHCFCKNTFKTKEISTFAPPGLDPQDRPRRPKSPQGPPRPPPRHSERTLCVFGPLWPLPKDPLGPPEDLPGTPRASKKTPKRPPRTPKDSQRTPKDLNGPQRTRQASLRNHEEAQRSSINL